MQQLDFSVASEYCQFALVAVPLNDNIIKHGIVNLSNMHDKNWFSVT